MRSLISTLRLNAGDIAIVIVALIAVAAATHPTPAQAGQAQLRDEPGGAVFNQSTLALYWDPAHVLQTCGGKDIAHCGDDLVLPTAGLDYSMPNEAVHFVGLLPTSYTNVTHFSLSTLQYATNLAALRMSETEPMDDDMSDGPQHEPYTEYL